MLQRSLVRRFDRFFSTRSPSIWSAIQNFPTKAGYFKRFFSSASKQTTTKQSTFDQKFVELEPAAKGLYESLRSGNRRSLSKAITLVESTLERDRRTTNQLVECILHRRYEQENASKMEALRIGLSGSPGVGKSTFIEAFGMALVSKGYKVAVLAVDPSSVRTKGSILGDKTRMVELSKSENAYIRPSPSRGTLGGVTQHTNETILLLEEAGFDIVIVETVGVGQSEVAVEGMVDLFAMLANPAAGDELQGIKKGIVELSDLVIVNKADGDLIPKARQAQFEYMSALRYSVSKSAFWRPRVLACSSLTGDGIEEVWNTMYEYWKRMEEIGELSKKRQSQRQQWMWRLIQDEIENQLANNCTIKCRIPDVEGRVKTGQISPSAAANEIVQTLFGSNYQSL